MSHFCRLKSKSERDPAAAWAVQEIERLRVENAELRAFIQESVELVFPEDPVGPTSKRMLARAKNLMEKQA